MSQMIEKVARAIYERRNGHGCKPWAHQTKDHRKEYLEDARVGIEAMREPNLDMVISGENYIGRHAYTAMINAALNKNNREAE